MPSRYRIALFLGLLFSASCAGGGDEVGPGRPKQAQSPRIERFVGVSPGIVRDTGTGLEWTNHDRERDLAWHQAERYCRELRLGGRPDWRLPEIDELEGLYDTDLDRPCGDVTCHLDGRIGLTNPYVWSGTPRGPERWSYFDFRFGGILSPRLKPGLVRRVLCVRRGTP